MVCFALPVRGIIQKMLKHQDELKEHENPSPELATVSDHLLQIWKAFEYYESAPSLGLSLYHWNHYLRDPLLPKSLPTFEVRVANGTLDPIIWQRNIQLISRLIELSLNKDPMVQEVINRRYGKDTDDHIMGYYDTKEELLFEFLDLIGRNNREKLDCMKQYKKKKPSW